MTTLTRRSVLSSIAVAPAALRAYAGAQRHAVSRLFVGTYTDMPGGSKGIHTCSWNAATGELGEMHVAAETPNPTFLIRAGSRVYAVNELSGDQKGSVSTFTERAGVLKPLNVVSSTAAGPCHVAIDKSGQAVFVANYSGGALSSYKVAGKGLGEAVTAVPYAGHSISDRQQAAHTHCVTVSPDNKFLVVNDLGLDRIMVYKIDTATAALTPAATPYWNATAGSGPRHTVFHPGGRWLYSVNELNSTIDLLAWESMTGGLTHKATISSLPPEAREQKNAPAELATDAAGKFLYVSNRFHDSISVFAIDPATGELTAKQDIASGGKTPRFFTLDPSGRWILVANQDGGNIVVLERNAETGMLTATGRSYNLGAPVCIVFA